MQKLRTLFAYWALVASLAVAGATQVTAPPQPEQRTTTAPLSLNRFPQSVLNVDKNGFYKMGVGIGDDYFDGTDSRERVRRHLRIAREVGAKYLRCAFSWNGIENEQGKFRWQFWDMLVDEATRAGIQLTPYVAYTPEWAARSKEEFWQHPPSDPAMFARFMETVAARYKGKIVSWELWNEPDLTEYWQGTPQEFAALVRAGAAGVRRGNPDAVLVLGGMSRGPSAFFEHLMEDEQIADTVDVIAQHAYPESWDPERAETIYFDWPAEMNQLIKQSGRNVDFWLNEIGYPDYRFSDTNASKYGGTDVYYKHEHSPRYQGVMLFRSFVMARANNQTSVTTWYRIDDFPASEKRLNDDFIHRHLGVVEERGNPKPDFQAFRFFNQLFAAPVRTVSTTGTKLKEQKSSEVVSVFQRKDGDVIVTGWIRSSRREDVQELTGKLEDTRSSKVDVDLPCRKADRLRFFDPFGKKTLSKAAVRQKGKGTTLKNFEVTGTSVSVAIARCLN